jgi:hypothetical protein
MVVKLMLTRGLHLFVVGLITQGMGHHSMSKVCKIWFARCHAQTYKMIALLLRKEFNFRMTQEKFVDSVSSEVDLLVAP